MHTALRLEAALDKKAAVEAEKMHAALQSEAAHDKKAAQAAEALHAALRVRAAQMLPPPDDPAVGFNELYAESLLRSGPAARTVPRPCKMRRAHPQMEWGGRAGGSRVVEVLSCAIAST
jgi:hypothetical protein